MARYADERVNVKPLYQMSVAHGAPAFSCVANCLWLLSQLEYDGLWETILDHLNRQRRRQLGKKATPSFGIIDSQSVKTIYASEDRGIDGGKKTKGRKRHHMVDIHGHLLHVSVHAANRHDTKTAPAVLALVVEKHPGISAFSADAGYRGTTVTFVETELKLACHISTKIKDGFAVLPKRWIVDARLHGWETFGACPKITKF